jgi:steroid delta-isomerase-like uncharacterized protein
LSSIEVARRYVDAWNARDSARLMETFRPGGTYEDPSTGGRLGTEALAGYAGGLFTAFPDLKFEWVSMREAGPGAVTFAWVMRGTNRGSLRGLPPTGATIALPGVDLIDVAEDGVRRVRGFFDRAALMEQLGMQVAVMPYAVGPVHFGVCTQVRSESRSVPGAVALTMIDARSDAEVPQIREVSRRIMLQLPRMPGFLSFQGAVVGRRLTTVTLWETPEAARQIVQETNHREASAAMISGTVGAAFHASTWAPTHIGQMRVRCERCGGLRDVQEEKHCTCGAEPRARPAFW